jgi:hypothetical protein
LQETLVIVVLAAAFVAAGAEAMESMVVVVCLQLVQNTRVPSMCCKSTHQPLQQAAIDHSPDCNLCFLCAEQQLDSRAASKTYQNP